MYLRKTILLAILLSATRLWAQEDDEKLTKEKLDKLRETVKTRKGLDFFKKLLVTNNLTAE